MKKLLMALSVLGITASSAATVVSCGNTDKDPVTDKVAGAISSELVAATTSRLTLEITNSDAQTQANVEESIISQSATLQKYRKKLTLKFSDFKAPSQQGDQGTITLEVFNKKENIKNSQDNTNQFKFSFLTKEIVNDMTTTISQVTTALDNQPSLSLSNINIDLSGTGVPTLKDIKTVGALINFVVTTGGNLIPAKVPADFTNDSNWTGFQGLISLVKPMIGDNDTINETISPMEGTTLNINFKITDVLKDILPDLIHLKNFVVQENQNGNKNLILNLIHYFFAPPADIDGDGFAEIDQGIKDNNDETKTIAFATNLERLVYHLLEGWKTANGTPLPSDVKPIHIDYNDQPIRYQSVKDKNNPVIGIFDLVPETNINNVLDLLLGTQHTWNDTTKKWETTKNDGFDLGNPESLTLTIGGLLLGLEDDLHMDVPTKSLADAIKGSLKTFLANSNPELATKLDYLTLEWTKGTMTVWYQTKDGPTWQQAKSLDDLAKATNLRVQFINNTWLVHNKLNDNVATINDKILTLNLDLNTNLAPASGTGKN